jgi:hypothetical protein
MNDPRESMEGAPLLGSSHGRYSMFRNGCQLPRDSPCGLPGSASRSGVVGKPEVKSGIEKLLFLLLC